MEDQDKERAEFEAWFRPTERVIVDDFSLKNGKYVDIHIRYYFEIWQASSARYTARIAELVEAKDRAERALLRAGYTHLEGAQEWRPPIGPNPSPLLKRIAELEAEVLRLKSVIKGYGHKTGCRKNAFSDQCTCGIDEAMKGGA